MSFLFNNARWLGAGALLAFSSSYGQTFFISIFADDIRAQFGLSHGEWGLIYGIGTGVSAFVMIWAGMLSDVLRVRQLAPLTLILLAMACLAMALNPFSGALVAVVFALRFSGQGVMSHISSVAMARWFVASRGKALAVATLGFAFAEAFLPMIFVGLKPVFGWKALWVLAGGMALAAIPILLVLLRSERTPANIAQDTQSLGMGGREWTRIDAIKHPLFWCFVPSVIGMSALLTALFFHQIHLGEIKGWTHAEVTRLFPVYTFSSIGAMLLAGVLIDRLGSARLVPVFQLPIVAGFLVFSTIESLWGGVLAMMLIGVSHGFSAPLPGAFWAEHYGTKNLGAIKSLAAAMMVLGSALGPWITGGLIDRGVHIGDQFLGFAAFFTVTSALAALGIRLSRAP